MATMRHIRRHLCNYCGCYSGYLYIGYSRLQLLYKGGGNRNRQLFGHGDQRLYRPGNKTNHRRRSNQRYAQGWENAYGGNDYSFRINSDVPMAKMQNIGRHLCEYCWRFSENLCIGSRRFHLLYSSGGDRNRQLFGLGHQRCQRPDTVIGEPLYVKIMGAKRKGSEHTTLQ